MLCNENNDTKTKLPTLETFPIQPLAVLTTLSRFCFPFGCSEQRLIGEAAVTSATSMFRFLYELLSCIFQFYSETLKVQ